LALKSNKTRPHFRITNVRTPEFERLWIAKNYLLALCGFCKLGASLPFFIGDCKIS